MGKNLQYDYYRLSPRGARKEQYLSYADIACEYNISRNSIAGKFDRAKRKNQSTITINNERIEKVLKLTK